jgi:DNA-binding MarR family transcriptional regulator
MNRVQERTGDIVALWMQTARLMQHKFLHAHRGSFNPMQMFALFIISEHDGLTMKELAAHLHITSPSTTSLVNRLVRTKWVTRKADLSNRKLVRVYLAPVGRKMLSTLMKRQSATMRDILLILNSSDRRDFARILLNLRNGLLASRED